MKSLGFKTRANFWYGGVDKMKKVVGVMGGVFISVLWMLIGINNSQPIIVEASELTKNVEEEENIVSDELTDNGDIILENPTDDGDDTALIAGSDETEDLASEETDNEEETSENQLNDEKYEESSEPTEEDSEVDKSDDGEDIDSEENSELDTWEYSLDEEFEDEQNFAIDRIIGSLVEKPYDDTEDIGNEIEAATKDYDRCYKIVANMIKDKRISNGERIRVRGYYAENDGGLADYIVSNQPGDISLKIINGLYANLVVTDKLNLKQLGAVGDGVNDDSAYLKKALVSGASNIIIPTGIFNLNYKELKIPKNISISGEGASKSVLCNLNFKAPYGLRLSKLCCKGAFKRNIWNTSEALQARTMFCVSPQGEQSIEYTNCTFEDADYVSWAIGTDGYFSNEKVTGCTFSNIGCCAIYHSANTKHASYKNNKFNEIGTKSSKSGPITAIWVGDVTNVNYSMADYIEIIDNTFNNLYTVNEFDENVKHVINANFIAVRADVAVISGNSISNLVGYGNDREAIYTKVRNLTIDGNYIKNGGSGEGYICNKGQTGDTQATISNNTLEGDFGCGIRTYGTAKILGNNISIKHCKAGIIVTQKEGQTSDWPLEISNNTISGGADKAYYVGKQAITGYSSDNLIKVVRPINTTKISYNTLLPDSNYSSFINVGNAKGNVTVEGNEFYVLGMTGRPITVYDKKDFVASSKQTITISKNNVSCDVGLRTVSLVFESLNTTRKIIYNNNEITFEGDSGKSYALACTSSSASKDQLQISGNVSNLSKKELIISTNVKKVSYNDDSFATLVLK